MNKICSSCFNFLHIFPSTHLLLIQQLDLQSLSTLHSSSSISNDIFFVFIFLIDFFSYFLHSSSKSLTFFVIEPSLFLYFISLPVFGSFILLFLLFFFCLLISSHSSFVKFFDLFDFFYFFLDILLFCVFCFDGTISSKPLTSVSKFDGNGVFFLILIDFLVFLVFLTGFSSKLSTIFLI